MTLTFTIPGIPVPKGRPRFSTRGGKPRTYTDAKTRAYEAEVTRLALIAMTPFATGMGRLRRTPFPLDGPLELSVRAYFPRPKSKPRRLFHDSRPDADNIGKAICDGLQMAGVFRNDAQIVRLEVSKLCGNRPCVMVDVTAIDTAALAPFAAAFALADEALA